MIKEKPRSAGQVLLIPNELIYPNPNQPRRSFNQEELVNLAISIRMNGILQPITVRETGETYEVVSGERRLRASRLAGMLSVPYVSAATACAPPHLKIRSTPATRAAASICFGILPPLGGVTIMISSTPAIFAGIQFIRTDEG